MNSAQKEINEAARIAAICTLNGFTYNYRSAVAVTKIRTNYRWSFTVNYNNFQYRSRTAQAYVLDTFFSRTSGVTINAEDRNKGYMGFTVTFSGVAASEQQAYADAVRVMACVEAAGVR